MAERSRELASVIESGERKKESEKLKRRPDPKAELLAEKI